LRIKKITVLDKPEKVYDIEVKDNHNFFAGGILVHNCIRALLKKLGKANRKQSDLDEWNNVHVPAFEKGCLEKGISKEQVKTILDDIVKLSAYSFNKSHAYGYSYISMESVYLCKYFRNYYYSSSLSYDASKTDVIKTSMEKVLNRGYKIEPPDVNVSEAHFTPVGQSIEFGLNDINGVGFDTVATIEKNRPYTSIFDFISKNINERTVNKKVVSSLLHGGAFDKVIGGEANRKYYEDVVESFYKKKKQTKTIPLLQEKWEESENEIEKRDTTIEELMEDEKSYLGGLFFHNIFDKYREKIQLLYDKGYCLRDFTELREKNLPRQRVFCHVNSYRYHTDKNNNEMLFMEIEDKRGEKVRVPIFASHWQYCKKNFFCEDFYLLDLYVNEAGDIMFGSKKWVKDPNVIQNFMIRIPEIRSKSSTATLKG
jgi:DNA polymerase III alpha subunit